MEGKCQGAWIQACTASSHVPGKNTTDIALVIDAMDILRDGQVDCFCLVASDGDYSLLAQRSTGRPG